VVANCSDRVAAGVSLVDRLPRGTAFPNRLVRWNTGMLTPGASKTYRITTRFNRRARVGRHTNRVTADADNAEPQSARAATAVTG
jgi:hypothetical protein